MNGLLTPVPIRVHAMAAGLVALALDLEETAASCAIDCTPENFDAMHDSMRATFAALLDGLREIGA